jgi:hypothetical protein
LCTEIFATSVSSNVSVGVEKNFPFFGGNAFIKGAFEGQMDDISSSRRELKWNGGIFGGFEFRF